MISDHQSKLPFVLLAIVWIFSFDYSLSTFIFHGIVPYDQKRMLQLFLLIFISISFFIIPIYRNTIISIILSMRLLTQICFTGFLFFGFISCFFSRIPLMALLDWSLYVLLIFFALSWCALALQLGERFYFFLITVIFLVIAAYLYPVVMGYIYSYKHNEAIYFFPYFINIRFFSQFGIFTLALLPLADIALSKRPILKYGRPLIFFLASFWWALMIVNGSRGLFYSFIITTLIGLIVFRKTLFPWAWRQFCFLALGILAVFLFATSPAESNSQMVIHKNISHISNVSNKETQPRVVIYSYALKLIEKHPLLGVGPMHFAYAQPAVLKKNDDLVSHPHSTLLLFLSEWGIPAGILLLAFVLRNLLNLSQLALYINKSNQNSNKKIIFISFAMSLVSGLLYSLVSGIAVTPLAQTIFAIITGSCLALYYENTPLQIKSNKALILTMGFILFFSISIILYKVMTTVPNLTQSEAAWLQAHGLNARFNPRFWLQGWLT